MEQRTKEALEALRCAPWFECVGAADTSGARVVHSWADAAMLCSTVEWQDFILERANDYRDRLRFMSKELINNWNERIKSVRPTSDEIALAKTQPVTERFHMPLEFFDAVSWDILHFAMEVEYADVCRPGFFARQGAWYMRGHFPCGWQGNFPGGKPIIF